MWAVGAGRRGAWGAGGAAEPGGAAGPGGGGVHEARGPGGAAGPGGGGVHEARVAAVCRAGVLYGSPLPHYRRKSRIVW